MNWNTTSDSCHWSVTQPQLDFLWYCRLNLKCYVCAREANYLAVTEPRPVWSWLSLLICRRVQGEESPSNKLRLWTKEGWRNMCWKNVSPLSAAGMLTAPPVRRRKIPGNKLKKCKTMPTSCCLLIDWLRLGAFLFLSNCWRYWKTEFKPLAKSMW